MIKAFVIRATGANLRRFEFGLMMLGAPYRRVGNFTVAVVEINLAYAVADQRDLSEVKTDLIYSQYPIPFSEAVDFMNNVKRAN